MMPTHVTAIYVTEALCLLLIYNCFKQPSSESNGLHSTSLLLLKLVSTTCFNSKAIPTIDTDYSSHIKAVEFIQPIIWGLYHATSY